MKIGAQFFTIRDYCRTPEALDESLKRVADIGYRHIQLSGVCPYEADSAPTGCRSRSRISTTTAFSATRPEQSGSTM